MTRAEALANLAEDAYPSEEMREKDKAYFIKKMEMTEAEFEEMMNAPTKSYLDYKGYFNNSFYKALYSFAFSVHNILKGFNYYGKRAD
jgi:predicted GTPase